MRTIIAGSRDIDDYDRVKIAVFLAAKHGIKITEVVSGGARGVDRLGERWAAENEVPVKLFKADWGKYGKRAGFLRNTEMAEYADALIAIRLNKSRGTSHMINEAIKKRLKVYVLEEIKHESVGFEREKIWKTGGT